MSEEDVTKGTRYFNALRDVADAARKVEEARVKYEDTLDKLMGERKQAEQQLREALARAAEMTGDSLPVSQRDRDEQRLRESLQGLNKKGGGK